MFNRAAIGLTLPCASSVVAETSDRCIEDPDVIERILTHLAENAAVGHSGTDHPGRDPPQLEFFA